MGIRTDRCGGRCADKSSLTKRNGTVHGSLRSLPSISTADHSNSLRSFLPAPVMYEFILVQYPPRPWLICLIREQGRAAPRDSEVCDYIGGMLPSKGVVSTGRFLPSAVLLTNLRNEVRYSRFCKIVGECWVTSDFSRCAAFIVEEKFFSADLC